MDRIIIENKKIGNNYPCFIIAEAGVNHNGDPYLAKKMIDIAAMAGADAIKFQTFHAEDVVLETAAKAEYQKTTTGADESQYSMIKKLELTENNFSDLAHFAHKKKIIFISTPFDIRSVDVLERIGVPAYKIPSGEINNYPLLSHIAQKHKPVIISTGMATLEEIHSAVTVLSENGASQIALLHCITSYPAKIEDLNLRVMQNLHEEFNLIVGFSDHSPGIIGSIAAVAMGASIIEKHFTLDKSMEGPDHQASLNPEELCSLITGIRQIEQAMGDGIKKITPDEKAIRSVARRSIVSLTDIPAGTVINGTMIALKRPGTGIDPRFLDHIKGKKTRVAIDKNTLISWEMLE
jgi:N,N'-diacetyllegionaminate synthase